VSVQSAPIAASALGDNIVVAAVPGCALRVVGYLLSFSAAANAKWMSDVGGGAVGLTGLLYGSTAYPAVAQPVTPLGRGWFQTAAGKALNLNLSAAVPVGGHVLYEVAPQ
jgi:hypothetical protein